MNPRNHLSDQLLHWLHWLIALFCTLAAISLALHAPARANEPSAAAYECATDGARGSPESSARCTFRAAIERLKVIQRRHEDRIMAIKGVIGMGIGKAPHEPRPVFVILIDRSLSAPTGLPWQIEGVEVRVERRAPVRLLHGGDGCAPCHRDQFPAPVKMGNSGGLGAFSNSACTMGVKACDLSSGRMVFVTNSHCNISVGAPQCVLATPGGIVDHWVHPGPFEQMGVPYEVGNVAGHAAPSCNSNNNLTDATKVTSPNTLTSIAVRDFTYYQSINPGDPLPGDRVQKSGRTTGYTDGEITLINVTQAVPADGGFCCGALTMKQQIEWLPSSPTLGGDSGSAVFSTEAPPRLVGLLFGADGAYSYANHVDNVLSALNITLDPLPCLSDCIYARAVRTVPPATTGNPNPWQMPSGLIELGHRYRNQVLKRSLIGQQFIAYFNQFSDEAILLAARSPGLLARTGQALATIAPSVAAVVESGQATVPAAHFQLVDELLAAYSVGASAELQEAIRQTRDHLKSPNVLRALGVKPER